MGEFTTLYSQFICPPPRTNLDLVDQAVEGDPGPVAPRALIYTRWKDIEWDTPALLIHATQLRLTTFWTVGVATATPRNYGAFPVLPPLVSHRVATADTI